MEKTINFYNLFFCKLPDKVRPGYLKYILEEPSLIFSFVENPERVMRTFGHLGFRVETPDDLIYRLHQTQKAGLVTREENGTNCCYAKQDKFWVTDPDGVQWEVYYFHDDAEFNDPHFEAETASACCAAPAGIKQKVEHKSLTAAACCAQGNCN